MRKITGFLDLLLGLGGSAALFISLVAVGPKLITLYSEFQSDVPMVTKIYPILSIIGIIIFLSIALIGLKLIVDKTQNERLFKSATISLIVLLILITIYVGWSIYSLVVPIYNLSTSLDLSSSQNSSISAQESENDKFIKSDLFQIQEAIYSYTGGSIRKSSYPSSLEKLNITQFDYFSIKNPRGDIYIYSPIENGNNYELKSTLDDGTIYIVYGNKFSPPQSLDIIRIANLKQIFQSLLGFYNDKNYYPNEISELIAAGWGTSVNGGPQEIVKDPVTKKEYNYKLINNKKDFILSSHLDIGIDFILRSNMNKN